MLRVFQAGLILPHGLTSVFGGGDQLGQGWR